MHKFAIVGCGVMGGYHANTISRNLSDQAELSFLADNNTSRAEAMADNLVNTRPRVLDSIESLSSDDIDAAIISTSSQYHAGIALELLDKGINVLIEKPIALSFTDAKAIDEKARYTGLTAMVGHVELFNPVVSELIKLTKDEDIRTMRFKRLGKVQDHSRIAHDVVQDLMLHDISIAQRIIDMRRGGEASVLIGHGRNDTTSCPDPAEAIIRYDNNIDAHFRASRAYSGGKVRNIEIETRDKLYIANLLNKTIVTKSGQEGSISPDGTYTEEIRTASYFAQDSRQPLALEQIHFIKSIEGETTPESAGVSIQDALRIMKITDSILSRIVTR